MEENKKESKKMAEKELVEETNPDNYLFDSDPVFLINEAPTAKNLSMALEKEVPVVVILSLDRFNSFQEKTIWQYMNIPDLSFVVVDWAGDHSNIPFIKNKWREAVRQHHSSIKKEMKREYNKAKNGDFSKERTPTIELPPFFQNIIKSDDDEGPNDFFAYGPPPG